MAAFCRDCLTDAGDAARCRAVRLAAPGAPSPSSTRSPSPCRLRRVLRHDREARRSVARRQAGDHRRRQARRRVDRLLHRAHLRRALGDADVRGAAAVPARHHRPAQHGEIRRRRPRGARADAGADAAGRAAVDRRGFHRSLRHRAAARHERRPRRWRASPRRSRRRSASRSRSGSPPTSSSPRSPPISTSRAASRCWARPRPPAFLAPQAGDLHLRRRQGGGSSASPRRLPH